MCVLYNGHSAKIALCPTVRGNYIHKLCIEVSGSKWSKRKECGMSNYKKHKIKPGLYLLASPAKFI